MNNQPKQQLLVWWVLWAALLGGVVMIYLVLGASGPPTPSLASTSATSPVWLAAAIPVFISLAIRWGAIPLISNARVALPLFVIGIAMAEMTCFLGLFLFPARKLELFIVSAVGIIQFAPFFARRFYNQ